MIAFSPKKLPPLSFYSEFAFWGSLHAEVSWKTSSVLNPCKRNLHPILKLSTLKGIVKYFWAITSRLNNLLQLNIYSPKGTKNRKWVKDEVTAFNANCLLSHLICGFILGFGGFFVVLYIALGTALPGLAHELCFKIHLFISILYYYFYTVVWHK